MSHVHNYAGICIVMYELIINMPEQLSGCYTLACLSGKQSSTKCLEAIVHCKASKHLKNNRRQGFECLTVVDVTLGKYMYYITDT